MNEKWIEYSSQWGCFVVQTILGDWPASNMNEASYFYKPNRYFITQIQKPNIETHQVPII